MHTGITELLLYTRKGCSLCDELLAELQPLCADYPVAIRLIDVDTDDTLRRRYGFDVPVLTDGEDELCRHRLDKGVIEGWLENLDIKASSFRRRPTKSAGSGFRTAEGWPVRAQTKDGLRKPSGK
ncbi:MAG TPA: glutaredoxin family protein [Gammaproteobacteria bacterium]|nr:glutaredoxin family protein [Gammaproteobacteria bacterium]